MHRLANTSKRSISPLDPPVTSSQPDGANTQHITLYKQWRGERRGEEGRGEGKEGEEGEEGGRRRRGEEGEGEEGRGGRGGLMQFLLHVCRYKEVQ